MKPLDLRRFLGNQIKCFCCRKWHSGKGISRDGYRIVHKGFRLDSIIVSWVPVCKGCSTLPGRFKSVLVRFFGRVFSVYISWRIKSITRSKV